MPAAAMSSWLLTVSFVGCIEESSPRKEILDTESATTTSGSKTETEKTETVFGLNEVAVFETLKFTALEIKESGGENFFKPEEGNTFVGVKFEVENISNEEQTVSTVLLFEGYADDVQCKYSFNANCAFSDGKLDGTIAPGKKLIGWYALEVPANWQEIELDVQSSWLSDSTAKFVFQK